MLYTLAGLCPDHLLVWFNYDMQCDWWQCTFEDCTYVVWAEDAERGIIKRLRYKNRPNETYVRPIYEQ